MIDLFKKVIGYYALCYIVKHTLVVGRVVQEKFNKKVSRKPRFLAFVPYIFKTQDMCDKAIKDDPCSFEYIPDHFKTQGMCDDAVRYYPGMLKYVPDYLKTQEMCNEAMHENPALLFLVLDRRNVKGGPLMPMAYCSCP